jgi:hypothetical protein
MGVHDKVEILELLEDSIDRRDTRRWRSSTHPGRDLLSGQVLVACRQQRGDGPLGTGDRPPLSRMTRRISSR